MSPKNYHQVDQSQYSSSDQDYHYSYLHFKGYQEPISHSSIYYRGRKFYKADEHRKQHKQKQLIQQYEKQIKNDQYIDDVTRSNGKFIGLSFQCKYDGQLNNLSCIISEAERRKMQKLFRNVIVKKISKVKLKYSKNQVKIFYEYFIQGNRYLCSLRDIIKANHQIKNFVEPQFIFGIYGRLYNQVSYEYWQIAKWAFYYAQQFKISLGFTQENFYSSKQSTNIFYVYDQQIEQIKFSIINHRHDVGDFTSSFIEQNKQQHKEYYNIYRQFKGIALQDVENQCKWNFKGFEQLDSHDTDSQNEIIQEFKEPIINDNLLKKKIIQILQRNPIVEKDRLQTLKRMNKDDQWDQKETFQTIQCEYNEITELKTNIQHFEQIVRKQTENFQRILRRKKKITRTQRGQKFKVILRKLIFAQKLLTSKLPILSSQSIIIKSLLKNNILIIQGETGSGKSTQIPQIIRQYYSFYDDRPILITEPTKLATRSLAQRVAYQFQEKIHQYVEYQASSHTRKLNPYAKIIFKLDRIVIDQLEKDPLLRNYSCLIIDEAHQRTINIDLILGKIKQIIQQRNDFKVIITSASLDVKLFQQYYNVPSIKIPGRMYQVTQMFSHFPQTSSLKQKIMKLFQTELLKKDGFIKNRYKGHILIFCPSIEDVQEYEQFFKSRFNKSIFKILSLHPKLTPIQQKEVFQETQKVKMIFATSFAETSITINGIKNVIDSGFDKELVYDQQNCIYKLTQRTISLSSAKQRAGRAGRTSQGYCFRLYSKNMKQNMPLNKPPQIISIALDNLVLRLFSLGIMNIQQFPFITKPLSNNLNNSIKSLRMISCIDQKGSLTQIGKLLAKCPIEPMIGRAAIESFFYNEAIKSIKNETNELKFHMSKEQMTQLLRLRFSQQIMKIISILVYSNNFFKLQSKTQGTYCKRMIFKQFQGKYGDFFFLLKAYNTFFQIYDKQRQQTAFQWAQTHKININTIFQIRETYLQIKKTFKKFNISSQIFANKIQTAKQIIINMNSHQECIKTCLISSFLSTLSLYSQNPQLGYTMISKLVPLKLSNQSILKVKGIFPKWIICYNIYPNQFGQFICRAAQGIDYDIIKKVIPKDILEAYGIDKAQQNNPFYNKLNLKLPTKTYKEFISTYKNRNNSQNLNFLTKYNIIFNDYQNELKIFCLVPSNSDVLFDDIRLLLKSISQQFQGQFKYEYTGNAKCIFNHGLEVKKVSLKQNTYQFRLFFKKFERQSLFIEQFKKYSELEIQQYDHRIKITTIHLQTRNQVKDFLISKKQQFQADFSYQQNLLNQAFRLPKFQLTLKFYTGTANSQYTHIFLNYHTKGDQFFEKSTRKNFSLLMAAKVKLIRINANEILRDINLRKSKGLNGINLYHNKPGILDQCTTQRLLRQYYKQKKISEQFVFPWKIICFRTPKEPQCYYPITYWQKKLRKIFDNQNIPQQSYSIAIKGEKYRENSIITDKFVQFTARIQSYTQTYLEAFQKKYNGKSGILGVGILNCQLDLIQNVGLIKNDVYLALKQEYAWLVSTFKKKNPELIFRVNQNILVKGIYRVFIYIKGQKNSQQIMLKYSRIIRKLFTPFTMKIQQKHHYLFDKNNKFIEYLITDTLQVKFDYKIYFIFDKLFSTLFIYAHKNKKQIIQKLISNHITNEHNLSSEVFSYVQISLTKLQKVIQQKQSQILSHKQKVGQNICLYDINYSNKNILVTADPQTFLQLKAKIVQIKTNKQISQCLICCGELIQPYHLLSCEHNFCVNCLTAFIKQQAIQKKKVVCPAQDCNQPINNYDIRELLNSEEIKFVCDNLISQYVNKSQELHNCYTSDCPQIFSASDNQYFKCGLCGVQYCKKCHNSHDGPTCAESEDILSSLGIKRCPKCKEGIQKNKGCNHITCLKCDSHICWQCLAYFSHQSQCYKHMLQIHGRFADDMPLQNMMIMQEQQEEQFAFDFQLNEEIEDWDDF